MGSQLQSEVETVACDLYNQNKKPDSVSYFRLPQSIKAVWEDAARRHIEREDESDIDA